MSGDKCIHKVQELKNVEKLNNKNLEIKLEVARRTLHILR